MSKPTLALFERVRKLFESSCGVGERWQTDEQVAASVSAIVGHHVAARVILSLRSEVAASVPDTDLLCALAQYFDAPRTYLWTEWDREAQQFDGELSLLLRMRDLGVTRLAMRDGSEATAEDLVKILEQLPQAHRPELSSWEPHNDSGSGGSQGLGATLHKKT